MPRTTRPAPAIEQQPVAQPLPAPSAAAIDATHHPHVSAAGVVGVVLTLVGWTTIPLFLRYFIHDIDGWTANGWRYGISALIWAPVLVHAAAKGTMPKGLWRASLTPSLWNAAAQICFGLAPYFLPPALMIFSMRLQIVFVAVAAAVMFPSERRVLRSPAFLAALAVTVIGTMLTLLLSPAGLGHGTVKGIALAIVSGFLYAMYALGVRKNMVGMNPVKAFAAVSIWTSAILVLGMLIRGDRHGADVLHLSPHMLTMLVLSAVIGIGLGHTFYFFSIARLGLVVTAGVVQLQPIAVAFASTMLLHSVFHEELTRWQWVTGLSAVAGAVGMLWAQHRLAIRLRRAG